MVAQANLNADLVFPPPSTYVADPHAVGRRNLQQTQLGTSQTTSNAPGGAGTMLHQLQNQRRSVGMIEMVPGQQHPSDKINTKIYEKTQ